jgi:hypothetical protein
MPVAAERLRAAVQTVALLSPGLLQQHQDFHHSRHKIWRRELAVTRTEDKNARFNAGRREQRHHILLSIRNASQRPPQLSHRRFGNRLFTLFKKMRCRQRAWIT